MRSATEIAALVRRGDLSPIEVAEEALRLADRWQASTNAFTQLRPEVTLAEARGVADVVAAGDDPGPLAGVPVAVKDLFDVEGWETTGCCAAFRGRVAERDAEVVRRLRAAGGVVLGKTNQHELAAGATNLISDHGPTRNPWDLERITGGSSGGSAAAVATGVVPLALGSDTGGSIRIPASMCGVIGVKPTNGAVPMDGAMPLSRTLDVAGPLSRTVVDARLALEVLTGRPVAAGGEGPTVAVLDRGYGTLARDDVLAATTAVADQLAATGVTVRTGEVRGIEGALEVWERLAWAELALEYPKLMGSAGVHPRTAELLAYGRRSVGDLEDARRRMAEIGEAFLEALREADALLLPATPMPAPRMDERVIGSLGLDMRSGAPSVLTRPINLAGLPAVSIPAGPGGMPIGVQLVGRPGMEGMLLDLASRRSSDVEAVPEAPA